MGENGGSFNDFLRMSVLHDAESLISRVSIGPACPSSA